MDSKEFQALLRKYREGNATIDEIRLIDHWYHALGEELPDWNKRKQKLIRNSIYERIAESIDSTVATDTINIEDTAAPSMNKWRRRFILCSRVAAVLGGGLLTFFAIKERHHIQRSHINANTQQEIIVEAGLGQIKKLTLPDSTIVWLNGGSKIRFEKTFQKADERKIYLDYGELHLDVKRDTAKPFFVSSDLTLVKVLGTSFTIKAYDKLTYEQISVSSGLVQVHAHGWQGNKMLKAGDVVKISRNDQQMEVGSMDLNQNGSWRSGVTYLEQASFEELALVIKNIYGMQLMAQNRAIEKQRYTLIIDRKVSFDDLVGAISAVNNNQFKKEGGQVIIY